MTGSRDRLDLVKDVFERREKDVARRYGQFQATLAQAVEQLELLRQHRDQQVQPMRSGIATEPSRLQNRIAFLARLNAAIREQELVIERAKNDREELKRRWLAARRKTQSVDKLSDRRRQSALKEEARVEQKQLDELAARLGDGDEPV